MLYPQYWLENSAKYQKNNAHIHAGSATTCTEVQEQTDKNLRKFTPGGKVKKGRKKGRGGSIAEKRDDPYYYNKTNRDRLLFTYSLPKLICVMPNAYAPASPLFSRRCT